MAFQVAYFSLYGRFESTYEPAMTKAFHHGRTEGIRTVSPASVNFARKFCSDAPVSAKLDALRTACLSHTALTRNCAQGLGQDRHLYALYSLAKPTGLPELFLDPGYALLNHSVLSTSNCGNPALRLFGFGPVVDDGFGIGYIIKENALSFVASSKHRQTRRFLDCLRSYLLEMARLLGSSDPGGEVDRGFGSSRPQRVPREVGSERLWDGSWNGVVQAQHHPSKEVEIQDRTNADQKEVLNEGYGFFVGPLFLFVSHDYLTTFFF